MPNQLKPVYSSQLGAFMDTPEVAATIKAWTVKLNVTHGQIMRDVVRAGLATVIEEYESSAGPLSDRAYAALLREERGKGTERARKAAQAKRAARRSARPTTPDPVA